MTAQLLSPCRTRRTGIPSHVARDLAVRGVVRREPVAEDGPRVYRLVVSFPRAESAAWVQWARLSRALGGAE